MGKLKTEAMFRPAHSPPPNTQQKDESKVGKLRLPQDLCTSGESSLSGFNSNYLNIEMYRISCKEAIAV